jgi:hypothetical protein
MSETEIVLDMSSTLVTMYGLMGALTALVVFGGFCVTALYYA